MPKHLKVRRMIFANDEEEVRGGKEGIKEAVLLMERTGKSVICQIGGEDEGSSGSEIHSFHFLQRAVSCSVCPPPTLLITFNPRDLQSE